MAPKAEIMWAKSDGCSIADVTLWWMFGCEVYMRSKCNHLIYWLQRAGALCSSFKNPQALIASVGCSSVILTKMSWTVFSLSLRSSWGQSDVKLCPFPFECLLNQQPRPADGEQGARGRGWERWLGSRVARAQVNPLIGSKGSRDARLWWPPGGAV